MRVHKNIFQKNIRTQKLFQKKYFSQNKKLSTLFLFFFHTRKKVRDNTYRTSSALRHAAAARSNDVSFRNVRRESQESKKFMAVKKVAKKAPAKKVVKKAVKKAPAKKAVAKKK